MNLVYSLATQHDNLGDLLINKMLVNILAKRFNIIIEDINVPEWFFERVAQKDMQKASSNAACLSIKSWVFYIRLLIKKPCVDYVVLSPGHMGDSSLRATLKKLTVLLASAYLRIRGIYVVRVGVSHGHLGVFSRFIESLTALTFVGYGVRDECSKNSLAKFARNKCIVLPDLSFLALDKYKQISKENLSDESSVLLSFRQFNEGDSIELVAEKRLLGILSSRFNKVIFYTQVKYDFDVQNNLKKLFECSSITGDSLQIYDNIDQAGKIIATSGLVISNRLHVLLPALMLGKIALYYGCRAQGDKIVQIYKDLKLEELLFFVEDDVRFTKEKLDIIQSDDDLKNRIKLCVKSASEELQNSLLSIFETWEEKIV